VDLVDLEEAEGNSQLNKETKQRWGPGIRRGQTNLKKQYPSVYDLDFLSQNMFVIPVNLSKEHKGMLTHCKEMLEYRMDML
jgi:hypothetical protein